MVGARMKWLPSPGGNCIIVCWIFRAIKDLYLLVLSLSYNP